MELEKKNCPAFFINLFLCQHLILESELRACRRISESELFGYEAGAFTGAVKSKPGKFEQCNNGTLLLDEIGEMSPELQAKLLHVLQVSSFRAWAGAARPRLTCG